MEKTKFEKDLEVYFPKIYKLHQLGKWDKFLWETIYKMLDMADKSAFGEIKITYQRGKINHVYYTQQMTSREVHKDGFAIKVENKTESKKVK